MFDFDPVQDETTLCLLTPRLFYYFGVSRFPSNLGTVTFTVKILLR